MVAATPNQVRALFKRHHAYESCGSTATYGFVVLERYRKLDKDDERRRIVAAYLWQPPAPGASKSICPEAPSGVLALSRMVAVPRAERDLNHVSKPLRRQMRVLIDRTRWPVLVTYSDMSCGHTGHVYKCSGWERTRLSRAAIYEDVDTGKRVSPYSNGSTTTKDKIKVGITEIQRWEHWACERGAAATHMEEAGWHKIPIPGKVWRSGNQAHRWHRRPRKVVQ